MGVLVICVSYIILGYFAKISFSYCSAWGLGPQIIGPPILEQV